jgi:hypothetical protein
LAENIDNMKKIICILLCLLISGTASFAQDKSDKAAKGGDRKNSRNGSKMNGMATQKATQNNVASPGTSASKPNTTHMKQDGAPDKRFKENKEVKKPVHMKKDGTPDKRYKENK